MKFHDLSDQIDPLVSRLEKLEERMEKKESLLKAMGTIIMHTTLNLNKYANVPES